MRGQDGTKYMDANVTALQVFRGISGIQDVYY